MLALINYIYNNANNDCRMVLMLIKLINCLFPFHFVSINFTHRFLLFLIIGETNNRVLSGLLTRQQLTKSSWFNGHLDLPGFEARLGTYSKRQRRTQVYARNRYSPFLVVQASSWQSSNIEYLSDWLCRKVMALGV